MVYLSGYWGMGDSELSINNTQNEFRKKQIVSNGHLQINSEFLTNKSQQDDVHFKQPIIQTAANYQLNQNEFDVSPNPSIRTDFGTFFGNILSPPQTLSIQSLTDTSHQKDNCSGLSSTSVTVTLEQLSVSNNNNLSPKDSVDRHSFAPATAALHQYLDEKRAESSTVVNKISNKLLSTQQSRETIDNEDEIALQPLSNQVSFIL